MLSLACQVLPLLFPHASGKHRVANDSSKVTSYISKNCGEHEDAASKYFKEVCEDAGETICTFEDCTLRATH